MTGEDVTATESDRGRYEDPLWLAQQDEANVGSTTERLVALIEDFVVTIVRDDRSDDLADAIERAAARTALVGLLTEVIDV